jgi:Ser/Thr protein kinase RdoA (MazF antagonist)
MSKGFSNELRDTLKLAYGFDDVAAEPLRQVDSREVYKVTAAGKRYVLRCSSSASAMEKAGGNVAILRYLEENSFPAPRVVPTTAGDYVISVGSSQCFLATYLEGGHPQASVSTMRRMGSLAAQLHLLGESKPYPRQSPWSIARERSLFLERIQNPAYRSLERWGEVIPLVREAFEALPTLDDLPQSIIHTDIHEGNVIVGPDSQLSLTDWDDAGTGAAILDIGYVLAHRCISCADEASAEPAWHADLARSFLSGYESLRPLSNEEVHNLVYAMQFAALAYVFEAWVPRISMANWKRYHLASGPGFRQLVDECRQG